MHENGRFQLQLLGPFGLFFPDGKRVEITSRKSVALISLLATAPSGRRSREFLRDMLWGHKDPEKAQASLRRELSTLGQTLEAQGCRYLLVSEIQRISLNVEQIDVDVFRLGLGGALSFSPNEIEFLEGLDLRDCDRFEDWLRDERDRVHELLGSAQESTMIEPPTPEQIFGADLPIAVQSILDAAPVKSPKPSLAIAPFTQSADDKDTWLGQSVGHHLAKRISEFPQLLVSSAASTERLVERGLSPQEICRELDVTYLIEGRLLRLGNKIRAIASLVRGEDGEQVWAETIDGQANDIWDFQEEIANLVAPRIWSMVDISERDRYLRKLVAPEGPYDTYWRANALLRSWDPDAMFEASVLTNQMASAHPSCPWAASLAAYCQAVTYLMDYTPDRQTAHRLASHYCQAALRYGADNVEVLGYCAGTILTLGEDLDYADRIIARALRILPSFQPTLFWGGWVDIFRGDPERARKRFSLALHLNPASGARAQTLCGMGFAALLLQETGEASSFFRNAVEEDPDFPISTVGATLANRASGADGAVTEEPSPEMIKTGLALVKIFKRQRDRDLVLAMAMGNQPSMKEIQ